MSGCDVCLWNEDGEIDNDFYHEQTVRARKKHRCCECGGPIVAGAQYQTATGRADGSMFRFKTCALCAEIRTVFHCGGAFYFGTLWEDMETQAFDHLTTASKCFAELTPAAKGIVMDKWQAWKFPADPATAQGGA